MKIAETILEWQSVDDMPECDRKLAVLVKKEHKVELFTCRTLTFTKKKVDFLDYKVMAWAYLDIDKLQKDVENKYFNYSWVKMLHDNAIKGGEK